MITAVGAGIVFRHARLAIQVHRRSRPIESRSWSSETIYEATSKNWRQARAELVAEAVRGHLRIESLHWIRDVSLSEDLSWIRTGNGPAVMATLPAQHRRQPTSTRRRHEDRKGPQAHRSMALLQLRHAV